MTKLGVNLSQDLTIPDFIPAITIGMGIFIAWWALFIAFEKFNKEKINFEVDDNEPMNNNKTEELPIYYVWLRKEYIAGFVFIYDERPIPNSFFMPYDLNRLERFIDFLYMNLYMESATLDRFYENAELMSDALAEGSENLGPYSLRQMIGDWDSRIDTINDQTYRPLICLLRKAESVYLRYNTSYTRKPFLPGEEL